MNKQSGVAPKRDAPATTDKVEVVIHTGHTRGLRAVALSPDGRCILSGHGSGHGSVPVEVPVLNLAQSYSVTMPRHITRARHKGSSPSVTLNHDPSHSHEL
jgi:hypothetical protein